MPATSVIIADTQYLIRLGLKHLIDQTEQFEVLAQVSNEIALKEALSTFQPQVVIIDYNQGSKFNQESIAWIKKEAPQSNILIISADNNKESIYKVIEQGVNSFLTKECDEEEIINAITATAKGEKFFCHKILNLLLEKSFPQEDIQTCAPMPLSDREIEIVRLVSKGLIAKEIAKELHLSPHTVYTHRKNIMKKLKITTAPQLVIYALNNGILSQ